MCLRPVEMASWTGYGPRGVFCSTLVCTYLQINPDIGLIVATPRTVVMTTGGGWRCLNHYWFKNKHQSLTQTSHRWPYAILTCNNPPCMIGNVTNHHHRRASRLECHVTINASRHHVTVFAGIFTAPFALLAWKNLAASSLWFVFTLTDMMLVTGYQNVYGVFDLI